MKRSSGVDCKRKRRCWISYHCHVNRNEPPLLLYLPRSSAIYLPKQCSKLIDTYSNTFRRGDIEPTISDHNRFGFRKIFYHTYLPSDGDFHLEVVAKMTLSLLLQVKDPRLSNNLVLLLGPCSPAAFQPSWMRLVTGRRGHQVCTVWHSINGK